ncbi:MAG: ATP-binding cassette domain-containing protein [Nocardioides sp.]|nr:ATP-binding cassette domain-containing protein [Nocardioides sp.]
MSLTVRAGTVHAVIGENGAGKSTLMRMLAGIERPDGGSISVNGTMLTSHTARAAAEAGVGLVHQELSLADDLTVWENIVLGYEPGRGPLLTAARGLAAVAEVAGQFGLEQVLTTPVGMLPLSTRQRVEIAKVLYRRAEVVVLDEPTAILTPTETASLFAALRALADSGRTVLFISHKLQEVLEVADEISVMRDAEHVQTLPAATADRAGLATLVVGRELAPVEPHGAPAGDVVLAVEGLTVRGDAAATGVSDVDLVLRAGRVYGIAGVSGNGQDALVGAITGTREIAAGRIRLHDPADGATDVVFDTGSTAGRVRRIRDAGLAYIPVDRRAVGSAPGAALWWSSLAGRFWRPEVKRRRLHDLAGLRAWTREVISANAVKASSEEVRPHQLSGGNLQKYIVGRELAGTPRIVIAEDPTRGVDIGSALMIRQRLVEICRRGSAVLLVSTDLEELLSICDEVSVIYQGRLGRALTREQASLEAVGRAMVGLQHELEQATEGDDQPPVAYQIDVEALEASDTLSEPSGGLDRTDDVEGARP